MSVDAGTTGFGAALGALEALLAEEIAELRAGRFDGLEARGAAKAALTSTLETESAALEAALDADDDESAALRDRLDALAALIARDARLIERLQAVTGEVARDLERLRRRHKTVGLYGADGHRSAKDTLSRAPMDKSV